MYGVVDREYIRKQHFREGWSIRKIALQLGMCRKTVRKLLEDSQKPHLYPQGAPPASGNGALPGGHSGLACRRTSRLPASSVTQPGGCTTVWWRREGSREVNPSSARSWRR